MCMSWEWRRTITFATCPPPIAKQSNIFSPFESDESRNVVPLQLCFAWQKHNAECMPAFFREACFCKHLIFFKRKNLWGWLACTWTKGFNFVNFPPMNLYKNINKAHYITSLHSNSPLHHQFTSKQRAKSTPRCLPLCLSLLRSKTLVFAPWR